MTSSFLEKEVNWRYVQILMAVGGIIVAGIFAFQQNKISDRLLSLEETSREPLMLVYFDHVVFDKSGTFSGQLHFQNVGPVPISNLSYGVSDFWTGGSEPSTTPTTFFGSFFKGSLHQFRFHLWGTVIPPGKEYSIPISIDNLTATSKIIPMVWVGIVFTRYPSGPQRCVELSHVPRADYRESNASKECGPWWPNSVGKEIKIDPNNP